MRVIRFTKFQNLMLLLSAVVLVGLGIATFLSGGFNFGIDFQSGLSEQVLLRSDRVVSEATVRKALAGVGDSVQVRTVESDQGEEFLIRVGLDSKSKKEETFQREISGAIERALESSFGPDSLTVRSQEFIGPRFAGDLGSQTLFLIIVAMVLILLYIWFRFKLNYAVSAIGAVAHDVLFLMGFIGAMRLEISTATVAAVLTIIGYSLNDSVVIFDRIRENAQLLRDRSFREVMDCSITESLSRTIITSLTTLLAALAIYLFSTGTVKIFALNLVVGVIVGTYSSIFVASATLLKWHEAGTRRAHRLALRIASVSSVPKVANSPAAAHASSSKKSAASPPPPTPAHSKLAEAPSAKVQTAEEIATQTDLKQKMRLKKRRKKR